MLVISFVGLAPSEVPVVVWSGVAFGWSNAALGDMPNVETPRDRGCDAQLSAHGAAPMGRQCRKPSRAATVDGIVVPDNAPDLPDLHACFSPPAILCMIA